MLVPRSYLFTSSSSPSSTISTPPHSRDRFREKKDACIMPARPKITSKPKTSDMPVDSSSGGAAAIAHPRASAVSAHKQPTQPVAVPTPSDRRQSSHPRTTSAPSKRAHAASARSSTPHNADSLPPAVAALLAMTTIPRPKPNQFRRRPAGRRRISIDELVSEWKADDLSKSSLGTSPALDLLLENVEGAEEQEREGRVVLDEDEDDAVNQPRSISADSVPSLDADDKSVLSTASLSTSNSIRSKRSYLNLRGSKRLQNSPNLETCYLDHPLAEPSPGDVDPDESFILTNASVSRLTKGKARSGFKSNLTASLNAIKSAAISSLSSFSFNNTASSPQPQRTSSPPFSDDILWSHPFLFPRMTTEVRPALGDSPSEAQRRYFNPPLNFEEQEAPYQQALHAPYLAEHREDLPSIPMQTYSSRSGRRKGRGHRQPDPTSEAGRALCGTNPGLRLREPRENSDFLRVIVMEMNMRREGKLEAGRAKIWLPPRHAIPPVQSSHRKGEVPCRWKALTAE